MELVEKRGLKIFSGMSEQEVEELPFQKVSPILLYWHYDHPASGLSGEIPLCDGDQGNPNQEHPLCLP